MIIGTAYTNDVLHPVLRYIFDHTRRCFYPRFNIVFRSLKSFFSFCFSAYTTFYILGLILSMQVPFVGFQPLRTSEHMAAAGTKNHGFIYTIRRCHRRVISFINDVIMSQHVEQRLWPKITSLCSHLILPVFFRCVCFDARVRRFEVPPVVHEQSRVPLLLLPGGGCGCRICVSICDRPHLGRYVLYRVITTRIRILREVFSRVRLSVCPHVPNHHHYMGTPPNHNMDLFKFVDVRHTHPPPSSSTWEHLLAGLVYYWKPFLYSEACVALQWLWESLNTSLQTRDYDG